MSTRSTTAPAALAVTLADAKEYLRIDSDFTALDRSITRWIKSLTRDLEHEVRRSLVTQGWRLSLDGFSDALCLDYAPIVRVESIRFYDINNVIQTLDPADYLVDKVREPGYIVPAPGRAWPATYDRIHAVMVDYTAGYGATSDAVPDAAQQYILSKLAIHFDPALAGKSVDVDALDGLIDYLRVYG